MNPDKFARIAESLRQYRRAELRDFQEVGDRPVDALYVDPLPSEAVLNSVLSSNTTFLLGRKGTGKSTVFARAQNLLRAKKDVISTYVDVKSLYDIVDTTELPVQSTKDLQIDEGVYRTHILRKAFLGTVLAELLKEIDEVCVAMSLWDSWFGKKKSYDELRKGLSRLREEMKSAKMKDQELPILQQITRRCKTRQQQESTISKDFGGETKAGIGKLEGGLHATKSDVDKLLDEKEIYDEYSDVVLKSFPFDEIIGEIQDLLSESGLKRLVVFFDDFSELNYVDQRLFVDVVLAPLNNSSKEAVKLKIAGYPGRIYYGRIDPTKVDTISLDFAALYEAPEVQIMEQSAIDYVTRLLKIRFETFKEDLSDYFDPSIPLEQHMRLMFETTFNVPRLMGTLLHTCYLDRVSKNQSITQASLKLAARKYYESTVSQYFERMNRFALEPFENKLDRHNQQELLDCTVNEARNVRKKIIDGSLGGTYFQEVKNPPASHFIVSPNLQDLFQSLESNFFLSRYKDTRDKDGRPVTVYALYYGLAELHRIPWGYPSGREYRNYFVQRCFEFTGTIHAFLSKKQTIRCGGCGKCYSLDQKASFELFKWQCPECHEGVCSIVNLSDDFRAEVAQLRNDLMLENVELEILNVLHEEKRAMRAGEISALIDVTYQLVGKRTSKLQDRGLVDKKRTSEDGKNRSEITEIAESNYF